MTTPARPILSSGNWKWFALALVFLLVNAAGLWRIASSRERKTEEPETRPAASAAAPASVIKEPLRLREIEASNVDPERRFQIRLRFNAAPDIQQLPKFFSLATRKQEDIEYTIDNHPAPNQVVIVTAPVVDDVLNYTLQGGLPAVGESHLAAEKQAGAIDLKMNLVLRGMEADYPAFEKPRIRIRLSQIPDAKEARSFVEVTPPVEMTVSAYDDWWGGSGIELRGDFKPNGVYEVTLKEGLPAQNGSTLPKTAKRSIKIPPQGSAIEIDHLDRHRYLAPHGTLQVPVRTAGMKAFHASLEPVASNNLFPFVMEETGKIYDRLDLTGIGEKMTNLAVRVNADGIGAGTVELAKLSTRRPPRGIYRLTVWGDSGVADSRMIVVTDLGVAAKVSGTSAVVWVNALSTAQAAADVRVTLISDRNETMAFGNTDAQGLARLQWNPEKCAGDPLAIIAQKDDDLSYIDFARQRVPVAGPTSGAPYLEAGQFDAAVFTERGIYRPGETIFVQSLVRDSQLRAPQPFLAMLHVARPNGKTLCEKAVMLDAFGSVTNEIPLPDYASTGTYSIELRMPGTDTLLGRAAVAVEEFVPPQIRVQVEMPTSPVPAGEKIEATVKADFLFGREAANLPVTATVTYREMPFAPEKWKGWIFGDAQKSFPTVTREAGKGTLDEKGAWTLALETIKNAKPPAAIGAVVSATVSEPNGRAVTAYASRRLDVYPFYVGLRPSWQGTLRLAQTQHVDVAVLLSDESVTPTPTPLTLQLSRVAWVSALRRNANGRYEWVSERQETEIRKDTVTASAGKGTAWWPFAVDTAGQYLLSATHPDSGASASITFYAGANDGYWGEWSRESPDAVELEWERKGAYQPGETARLLIRSPITGEALLTIGQEAVLTTRRLTLEQNTLEIDIPVEEAFAPNAYATVMVIRPAVAESTWRAHRAVGTVPLTVERPKHRLDVAITAPARIEPQSPLRAHIRVRDAAGAPVGGRVTVMAVDEGICMLTAFRTPDPLAYWQRRRQLGISLYDLYGNLMPLMDDALESTPSPGGDGEASALRRRLNPIQARRFKPVALWQADVPLDANGEATAVLNVPEFTGALRLMAVAYTAAQAGRGTASVEVKRDLVVQPALPRFLATGDTCTSAIPLHNTSTNDMDVTVRLSADGPLRVTPAEQRITLRAGQSARLEAQWQADRTPGKAHCTIEATAANIVYRETIELAVRPAGGLQVVTTPATVPPNERLTLHAPKDWIPESCAASGALSAFASVQMGRALEYVVHYPYGCLEQTTSGAFPLLYAQQWVDRLPPAAKVQGDPAALVDAAISRIASMQVLHYNGGGFASWPLSSLPADAAASRYAIHFLLEAQKAGFTVPAATLDPAVAWLQRTFGSNRDRATQWQQDMQDKAYTCHILALAQKPDYGWMSTLTEDAAKLNTAARAHLATAWMLAGEPRKATAILDAIPLPAPRPRESSDWTDSDIRDCALLLMAWLEIDAETPMVNQLVQALRSRQRDGHFGSTQDNAFALLAFGKLMSQFPDTEKPFSGTVLCNGQTLAFGPTNDVSYTFGPGAAAGTLEVRNDGPGKAFLLTRFEGVANEPEPPKQQGLSIGQDYLDIFGKPLKATDLRQGDLVIARVTVDTLGATRSHLVIEALLPAGWEIENPNLKTSMTVEWLKDVHEPVLSREARDDRMLFFADAFSGKASFHYAIRAVTPGDYVHPPVTASGMYDPELRAVSPSGRITVKP